MIHASRAREKGYTLHTVLFTGLLACIGILLIFIAIAWIPQMNRQLEDNAVERMRETMQQTVSSAEIYTQSLESALHLACSFLSNTPVASPAQWQTMLTAVKKDNSDIVEFAFFDADGTCLYDTAGGVRLPVDQIRASEWFVKALALEGAVTYFSYPHVQNLFFAHRSYVITLAQALEYTWEGAIRTGVMLMDINYSALADLMNSVRLNTSGYVYLLDTKGELITHPRLSLINEHLATEDTTAVEEKVLGVTQDVQDGQERLLVISTLAQTRWRMVGVAYLNEVFQIEYSLLYTFFIALLSAALLGLAAAVALSYRVVTPIRHLESEIKRVESGHLDVTIPETGFLEIRAVSSAFNHMLVRIRCLMDQVVEEQEKKRLYELNALQAQINPHFLYNALDSIILMEEQGKSREAVAMVNALARLFRISISKGRTAITVSEEMEHVRNYTLIQKIRFEGRFECQLHVQPDAVHERTLKLIVQPIVENAIHHAIDEYADEPLHIVVKAWVEQDQLLLSVEDDGVGIAEDRMATILTASPGKSGIGLKNVHERIRLSYGEPYGLEIESEEDEGTRILIRQPRTGREER